MHSCSIGLNHQLEALTARDAGRTERARRIERARLDRADLMRDLTPIADWPAAPAGRPRCTARAGQDCRRTNERPHLY